MQLLTTPATTDGVDAAVCISAGGLVDLDTAASADVMLWTDPQSRAAIERAVTAARLTAIKRLRVA